MAAAQRGMGQWWQASPVMASVSVHPGLATKPVLLCRSPVYVPAISWSCHQGKIALRCHAVATKEVRTPTRSDEQPLPPPRGQGSSDEEEESWHSREASSGSLTAAKGVFSPQQVDVAGLATSVFRAQAMGLLVSVREAERKLEADITTLMVTILFMVAVIVFEYGVQSLLDHFLGDSVTGSVSCILVGLGMVFSVKLSGFKWSKLWSLDG